MLLNLNAKFTGIGMDIHGVRFDIFALNEDGTVIQIEIAGTQHRKSPQKDKVLWFPCGYTDA